MNTFLCRVDALESFARKHNNFWIWTQAYMAIGKLTPKGPRSLNSEQSSDPENKQKTPEQSHNTCREVFSCLIERVQADLSKTRTI